MRVIAPNPLLPPVHSGGVAPNPGPVQLMEGTKVTKLPEPTIPGVEAYHHQQESFSALQSLILSQQTHAASASHQAAMEAYRNA